jgi:hypothetical protein
MGKGGGGGGGGVITKLTYLHERRQGFVIVRGFQAKVRIPRGQDLTKKWPSMLTSSDLTAT